MQNNRTPFFIYSYFTLRMDSLLDIYFMERYNLSDGYFYPHRNSG